MARQRNKAPCKKTQGKETRTTLLNTGARLFAQFGYNGVSMRTLAAEAGVNLATVSYHFGSKVGLYQAILQQIIDIRDTIFPSTQEVLSRMDKAGDTLNAKSNVVDWYIETLFRELLNNTEYVWPTVIISRELVNPSELYPKLEQEFCNPAFEALYTLVERVLPHGTPKENVLFTAHCIIGIITKLLEGHTLITKRLGWDSYQGHLDDITTILKIRIRGFLGLPMENV